MKRELRHLTYALFILVMISIPLHRVVSFSLDDGLEIIDRCSASNILGEISRINAGYIKQLIADTLSDFIQSEISFAIQRVKCYFAGLSVFGSGSSGNTCTIATGGSTDSILKRSFMNTLKRDYVAACILDQTGNDINRIIQENGPDSGPAYVTDWDNLYSAEGARGTDRFYAELVNTNICDYFRDKVYIHFGVPQSYINNPPSLTGIVSVDGGSSFPQRAQCTLPPAFSPEQLDRAMDFDILPVFGDPQNNYDGFIRMAEEEKTAQENTAVQAARDDAVAGGGFRSTVSCTNRDPNGKCLAWQITQVSGGLRDYKAADTQAMFNQAQTNQAYNGVRMRILSQILDMAGRAADSEVSQTAQDYANGTVETPPVATPTPSSTCTTQPPAGCYCLSGEPSLEQARQELSTATSKAIAANASLLNADGTVRAGSEQAFLQAVCDSDTGRALQCSPVNGSATEVQIPIGGGYSVHYTVLVGDFILRPGDFTFACSL